MAGSFREASAHDLYTAYLQHHLRLTVGARYLDLTVDLTFFEEWSSRERRRMDADNDGRITQSEVAAYLEKLAPEVARQVRLLVAGRQVPLATLYEPELDLLGDNQAGPGHHRLRLFFFAPTPPGLHAADSFVIEDRLWPEAKALATMQTEGTDGCALEAEEPGDPALAPVRSGAARVFKAKCLTPPVAQSETTKPTRPSRSSRTSNPHPPPPSP